MPVDVTVYKAIDPAMDISTDDARGLAARLARRGMHVEKIVCHPQGGGRGFGVMEEVDLDVVLAEGVPTSEPIHLQLKFRGVQDVQSAALVRYFLGEGGVAGTQRIHDMLWPNSPLAYLAHLVRIPEVFKRVDSYLREA